MRCGPWPPAISPRWWTSSGSRSPPCGPRPPTSGSCRTAWPATWSWWSGLPIHRYRPRHRKRLLLIAAVEVALEHEQEVLTLEVRRSNEAALALYDKYGFSRAGIRRRYYENAEDAGIMTTPPLDSAAFQERPP